MESNLGKISGYVIILDSNGMPRIDKPLTVPQEVWDTLTVRQKEHVNSSVSKEQHRAI